MSAPVYIDVNEFMNHLKAHNLVIVKQEELEANNEIKRMQLLKKKHLSLTEIVKAGFFTVKNTETLRRWCLAGKFGKDGFLVLKNGQYRIMTIAIKNMLYGG